MADQLLTPWLLDNYVCSITMSVTIILVTAFIIDYVLGEPRRYHPLVGFGNWAVWMEARCYPSAPESDKTMLAHGALCWLITITLPLMGLYLITKHMLESASFLAQVLAVIVCYFAIAPRSLYEHAMAVYAPLTSGELAQAREKLSYIVSRDTSQLNEHEVATATVETVLENANDAVIAPIFWFAVAGLPGILLFRMVNTLDAMWGYRSERYHLFGKIAARIDDVMGYIPARLTFLLYLFDSPKRASAAWRDGQLWYSPNAGPVMAAGAHALNLKLGGSASYGGQSKDRPTLGQGNKPDTDSIPNSLTLTQRSYCLCLVFIALIEWCV